MLISGQINQSFLHVMSRDRNLFCNQLTNLCYQVVAWFCLVLLNIICCRDYFSPWYIVLSTQCTKHISINWPYHETIQQGIHNDGTILAWWFQRAFQFLSPPKSIQSHSYTFFWQINMLWFTWSLLIYHLWGTKDAMFYCIVVNIAPCSTIKTFVSKDYIAHRKLQPPTKCNPHIH